MMIKIKTRMVLLAVLGLINGVRGGIFGETWYDGTWTDLKTGMTWTFQSPTPTWCTMGDIAVLGGQYSTAVPTSTVGEIVLPKAFSFTNYGVGSSTYTYSVVGIGSQAFLGCSGLTRVTIPSSITNIVRGAFYGCSALRSFEVESGNTKYSAVDGVLFNKNKTELVAFPGGHAEPYVFPSGVKQIGASAFSGCSALTSIVIPSDVTSVGGYAFSGCNGLTSVTISDGMTSIGDSVFHNCGALTSIAIPSSVTSIGNFVFSGCSGLRSITVLARDLDMTYYTFSGAASLQKIEVTSDSQKLATRDGVLFDKSLKTLVFYPCGKSGVYSIPQSVIEIKEYAFKDCSELIGLKIPAGVQRVSPIRSCKNLRNVTIPSCVEKLKTTFPDDYANLTNVVLQDGFKIIASDMFEGCSNLRSITIPASVRSIEENAFADCGNLESVYYLGDAPDAAVTLTGQDIYDGTPRRMVSYVTESSVGWDGSVTTRLPTLWHGRLIQHVTPTPISDDTDEDKDDPDPVIRDDSDTVVVTNVVNVIMPVYVTNVVKEVKEVTVEKTVTVFRTNNIDVVYTNYVSVSDSHVGAVSENVWAFVPSAGFDGTQKQTLNGVVIDEEHVFCGLVQIVTAKATSKGVKVSGFVMLSDGKKQSLKSASGTVLDGVLTARTSVGKLGTLDVAVGADGFRGQLGSLSLVSADIDDTCGVLKGTLTLNYFDAKTNKLKTKKITVGGVASDGDAVGSATVKGQWSKTFAAEME